VNKKKYLDICTNINHDGFVNVKAGMFLSNFADSRLI